MKKIITWIVEKFGLTLVKNVLAGIVIVMVVSFYVFIASALVTFYNLIHRFFDTVSSTDVSNPILHNFVSLLNNIGFIPSFLSISPLLFSALVFLLTRLLYKHTLSALNTIEKTIVQANSMGGL